MDSGKQAGEGQSSNGVCAQTEHQFLFGNQAYLQPLLQATNKEANKQRVQGMNADLIEVGVGMLGRGQPEAVDLYKLEGWQLARLCLAPQAAHRLQNCGGLARAWHS